MENEIYFAPMVDVHCVKVECGFDGSMGDLGGDLELGPLDPEDGEIIF